VTYLDIPPVRPKRSQIGFVIGWFAIVGVLLALFLLMTSPLRATAYTADIVRGEQAAPAAEPTVLE
jgi:CDP-diglyceride synthetase